MKGTEFKNEIIRIMQEARSMYPEITDDQLCENGAIYYMNGNDGTRFDWKENNHLCEFFIFHKNELGFIKVYVNKNNSVDVFIFTDGGRFPTKELKMQLKNVAAEDFMELMLEIADHEGLDDASIDEMNWDVEI